MNSTGREMRQRRQEKKRKKRGREGKRDLDVLRHESNYRSRNITVQSIRSLNGFSPILVPKEGKKSKMKIKG